MSYIGNPVTTAAFLVDTFSGNSSNTAFTLSVAPATSSSIIVAISGLVQEPSTYGVVGRTLTFTGVPPTGTNNISVRYLGIPATGVTTAAYRSVTEFIAASGQTTFTVPSYTAGYIDVYQNGIQLASDDFTASDGVNIVLTVGATAGDSVRVIAFQLTNIANALPTSGGNISGNLNLASNLNFTGTGNRITGDFSNATIASRVMFQTSSANTTTAISAIPSGTGVASQYAAYSNSDPTNASVGIFANNNATVNFQSAITGTGTYLPMTFFTGGSERMRIDTSGNVGVGTNSPGSKLTVSGTGSFYASSNTNTGSGFLVTVTGAASKSSSTDNVNLALMSNDALASNPLLLSMGVIGNATVANGYSYLQTSEYGTGNWRSMALQPYGGNVGIGFNAPQVKLSFGTAGIGEGITNRIRIYDDGSTSTADTGISYGMGIRGSDGRFAFSSGNGYFAWYTGGGSVVAATEKMRIDSSGNVGIGTNSPNGRLVSVGASGTNQFVAGTSSGGGVFINAYDSSTLYHLAYTAGATPITGYAIGAQSNIPVSFFVNNAEKARIDTSGNLSLSAGNLVLASGKGIDFSAHSNSSGMTGELLDDYETGTWAPNVGGNATYYSQIGSYTRVGRLVIAQCDLSINVLGTGDTGKVYGLPFTAASNVGNYFSAPVCYWVGLSKSLYNLMGITPVGGNYVYFEGITAASTAATDNIQIFQNGSRIIFTAIYFGA